MTNPKLNPHFPSHTAHVHLERKILDRRPTVMPMHAVRRRAADFIQDHLLQSYHNYLEFGEGCFGHEYSFPLTELSKSHSYIHG